MEGGAEGSGLDFVTVYTEGHGVRCVTYEGGEMAATLLLDPERAEAFAHQLLTEAARARARKGADNGRISTQPPGGGDRERQQRESKG